MMAIDLEFVKHLTLKERADLVAGKNFWFTAAAPGLGRLQMADGPAGLRKPASKKDAAGLAQSIKAVCFPSAALLASSFDEKLLFELGQQLGAAAQAEKIGILLGPGVNLKRSPLAGRNFEYFSEDPLVAGKLGSAYVKGVQSKGVGTAVKHFAANNRENQRFTSSSNVSERPLRELYLSQFERIVKEAQPAAVMCSYNRLNGSLNSQNQRLLTDILRNEWGYAGLVMSDWGAVANHAAAIKAGLDLEMPGKGRASTAEILQAVKTGRLQESTLNRSVLRVLRLLEKYGQQANQAKADSLQDEHDFARQAADSSIVLLKNDHHELPLTGHEKIAIVGELAAKPRYQGGGSSHVNAYRLVTPLAAAPKAAVYAQGYRLQSDRIDQRLEQAAIKAAQKADRVIFFAGFPAERETEGVDKQDLILPFNQNMLLDKLLAYNPHITVVLQNGSVCEMPWADRVPAIVETYLAGEAVGEADWDILLGKVNPSGKLAESFPLRLEDNPTYPGFDQDPANENYREGMLVGYRWYDAKRLPVRFPFGHGLSYTTFAYRQLRVAQEANDVKVSFSLKNIGNRAGQETAQVYVVNQTSHVEMPAQELRAFVKIALPAGQEQTVTVRLPRRAFAWYDADHQQWRADNGQYEIRVGSSSRDLPLRQIFKLTIGTKQPVTITADSYLETIFASKSSRVRQALRQSGLYPILKKALTDPSSRAIFANMPLRALAATGIDSKYGKKFLQLLK